MDKKIEKKLDKVDEIINTKELHIFNNKYKMILSGKNNKDIDKLIKTLEPPKKETKIYYIRVIKSIEKNSNPLSINCTSITLTPDLDVFIEDDDSGQTVYYTDEDLLKYGFKMGHIQRIIKTVKYSLITFRPYAIPITKILKLFEEPKINKTNEIIKENKNSKLIEAVKVKSVL